MRRSGEPAGSTTPVIVAVVATLVVCALAHFAYNAFVLDRAPAIASKGGSPGLDSNVPQPESVPPPASSQNCDMSAALFRALAEANAAKKREECKPTSTRSDEDEHAADAGDVEAQSERAARFMEGNVETLEGELLGEKIDLDWAKKTEEAARRAVAAMTSGMRLDEVTCRTTLCRARVTHADPSRRGDDMMQLLGVPELSTQVLPYAPMEDEETTVIYFAREGHTLSVLSSGPAPASSPSSGFSEPERAPAGGPPPPTGDGPPPVNLAGG